MVVWSAISVEIPDGGYNESLGYSYEFIRTTLSSYSIPAVHKVPERPMINFGETRTLEISLGTYARLMARALG